MIKRFISTQRFGSADFSHHWSESSQVHAPAATLLKYVHQDWQLDPQVIVESFACYGGRHVDIYTFTLTKDDRQIEMPVLANPVVRRLIACCNFQVMPAGISDANFSVVSDAFPPLTEATALIEATGC